MIIIIIIPGWCLWCCHHDSVIARVDPVHAMNTEQLQMCANLWTRPTDLSHRHRPTWRLLGNYVHCLPNMSSFLCVLRVLSVFGLRATLIFLLIIIIIMIIIIKHWRVHCTVIVSVMPVFQYIVTSEMFVCWRYSELDRIAKQKDSSITKLREAAQEREAQLQAEIKSLTAQLEKSSVRTRQLEWTAQDLEKDKSSVVERLYIETKKLSVWYHVTASAHLRHHFLVALRLANLRYINSFNNNNNNDNNNN